MENKERGRPSKLTVEMIAKLVTAIETSTLTLERIAPHCGVTKQSYYSWIRKGEALIEKDELLRDSDDKDELESFDESLLTDHERLCMQLYEQVQSAHTFREKRLLNTIENIGMKKGDWRAIQWILKISHPTYRTAELPPEPDFEEEDEYEEDEVFKTPAPSDD